MKIALNNVCNSKCPYCFAGNMGINKSENISLDSIKNLLNWMVKFNDHELVILGGEPTLHPQFKEILQLINEYVKKYNWNFELLSNGVKLGEFIDDLAYTNSYLINVNSPIVLGGKKSYNEMINSIKILQKQRFVFDFYANSKEEIPMVLGCNLHYEANHNYDYFWDVVDKFNAKSLRVSVASPQNNKFLNNRDEYFKLLKSDLLEFINNAIKRQCYILYDCSQIPPCYFTPEELMLIQFTGGKDGVSYIGRCDNLISTVLPDLTVSCCFGEEDFDKLKVKFDFNKSPDEYLNEAYERKFNIMNSNYIEKCKDCTLRTNNICIAGCLGFTDNIKEN